MLQTRKLKRSAHYQAQLGRCKKCRDTYVQTLTAQRCSLRAQPAPGRAARPSQSLPLARPGAALALQLPFHQAMLYGQVYGRNFGATQPPRATTLPATTQLAPSTALPAAWLTGTEPDRRGRRIRRGGCWNKNVQLDTSHKKFEDRNSINTQPTSSNNTLIAL